MYALIIAGGRGERLKPSTDTVPKSMTLINGRPLLEYQVRWMRSQGVTDIVFLTGHLGESIQAHFKDGGDFGVRAAYSHEERPLGRGGAVRQGFQLVPDTQSHVLVTNGDVATDLDISLLMDLHRKRNASATLMLTRHPSQYGVVRVDDDGLVESFSENGPLPVWINAGVYIFRSEVKSLLPEQGDHEVETFPELARAGRLAALPSDAMWLTVDNAKDIRRASEMLSDPPSRP